MMSQAFTDIQVSRFASVAPHVNAPTNLLPHAALAGRPTQSSPPSAAANEARAIQMAQERAQILIEVTLAVAQNLAADEQAAYAHLQSLLKFATGSDVSGDLAARAAKVLEMKDISARGTVVGTKRRSASNSSAAKRGRAQKDQD